VKTQFVFLKKEGEMFWLNSLPPPHHLPELQRIVNPLFSSKSQSPFPLNGQPFPPLCSPSLQNFSSASGTHPLQKSVSPLPSEVAGLIGSLHFSLSLLWACFLKLLNFLFKPYFSPVVKFASNSYWQMRGFYIKFLNEINELF
jgi:hypothetical protein